MNLEAKLDWLFRSPLPEFVKARNELAKSLRKSGDRESADRIKALAKPTLTAWAVNQLAFRAPAELEALLEAGVKVRAAHLVATGEQQAAARERRGAVSVLVTLARSLMTEAGHAMSRDHRQRISRTLEVLASRGANSDELGAGRLSQDLEPVGFDALAGLAAALETARAKRPSPPEKTRPSIVGPVAQQPALPPDAAERERAAQENRRRATELQACERRLEEAWAAVQALEKKLADLEDRRDRAGSELEEAERAETELAHAALAAERQAREARQRADAARESTRPARLEADSAAKAVRRAEGRLAAARQELQRLDAG